MESSYPIIHLQAPLTSAGRAINKQFLVKILKLDTTPKFFCHSCGKDLYTTDKPSCFLMCSEKLDTPEKLWCCECIQRTEVCPSCNTQMMHSDHLTPNTVLEEVKKYPQLKEIQEKQQDLSNCENRLKKLHTDLEEIQSAGPLNIAQAVEQEKEKKNAELKKEVDQACEKVAQKLFTEKKTLDKLPRFQDQSPNREQIENRSQNHLSTLEGEIRHLNDLISHQKRTIQSKKEKKVLIMAVKLLVLFGILGYFDYSNSEKAGDPVTIMKLFLLDLVFISYLRIYLYFKLQSFH